MKFAEFLTSHKLLFTLLILFFALCIRLYRLDQSPPSPYWEEVAIGYDAYSILQTGKDHHGNPFPIVAFESFGDYKPTLYFYAVVPFIAVFGLNIWAVRLPSVIAGTLIVWGAGLIAERVGRGGGKTVGRGESENWKMGNTIYYIAMMVAAISPWAVQFSRAGWEVNLATCLVTFGVYCGLQSWDHKQVQWLGMSAVLLILSMYTYHSTRVIAPLLGVGIILPWLQYIRKYFWKIIVVGFASMFLLFPLILSLGDKTTSQRFAETSIFSDLSVNAESNHLIAEDNNTILARVIHHRYLLFANIITQNFLSHFQPSFLFLTGDINPRHSLQFFGQLYYTEFFFVLIGIFTIIYAKLFWRKEWWFLGYWLVIGILPAALTKATPHALRILPTLPVWIIIISLGIFALCNFPKNFEGKYKKMWFHDVTIIIVGSYFLQFSMFYHFYQRVYPVLYASHWQYGYQELVQSINTFKDPNEPIYITREEGRPAMFYWFYSKTDPKVVQLNEENTHKDQAEFIEFENINFVDHINLEMIGLIASSKTNYGEIGGEMLHEVKDQRGKVIWVIYRR